MNTRIIPTAFAALLLGFGCIAHSHAQLVILPAPRLLTTMPMGAKAGTTVEVTITGEHIEDAELQFSSSKVSAVPKRNAEGVVMQNKFVVSIAPDATPQICEARVMTRRGISSSRAFSIHNMEEIVREKPNTTLQTALPLPANSICNATTTTKAVDYYSIQTTKGHRYAIECATSGIDSKLTPVLIVADPAGRDLLVNRRSGFLDFTAPADGPCVIKVHGLTFQGGAENFYRLVILSPQPRSQASNTHRSFASARPNPTTPMRRRRKSPSPARLKGHLRQLVMSIPTSSRQKRARSGGSKPSQSDAAARPIHLCSFNTSRKTAHQRNSKISSN